MDLTRRRLLTGGLAGLAGVAGAKATYNVALGYDSLTGTNLTRQELDPLVAAGLGPSDGHLGVVSDRDVRFADGHLVVDANGGDVHVVAIDASGVAEARSIDRELGLDGDPLAGLVSDLVAIEADDVTFEYHSYPAFFDRADELEGRPLAVQALRQFRAATPRTVEAFAGVNPRDTPALVEALAAGFRAHTSYDVSRYLAGSVEDNVILGAVDLRRYFESPTDFASIMAGDNKGLFCYELVFRSIEAMHAVPAPAQTVPVFAGYVRNRRHKHAFTVVASIGRAGDDVVVPVTFLDYTRSTLYDDLGLRWLLGEGLDAYTTRQRATDIYWRL
ncbi:MAG: hypothetical protein ACOC42_03435 [Halobacteriota archaeon]